TNHGEGGAYQDCTTITNGTSPYPGSDPVFQQVVEFNASCCNITWGAACQQSYDFLSEFIDGESYNGNVGRHEKIFLKLIAESDEFRQLYYGRYADLMNTVFTCDNMINTLDSMIAVIEPEMPRQIERWGGTLAQWQENVDDLRDFINERCTLLDDGALNCYEELTGPYELVLRTEPDGIGEIDLNTLDIESFPWSGDYFGGMENKIKAKVFDEYEDEYVFSHWVSANGNVITPNVEERKAAIILEQADTLTAIFVSGATATVNLANKYDFQVFPNPASDFLQITYNLPESSSVNINLQSILGQQLINFPTASGLRSAGTHNFRLDLDSSLPAGLYLLEVHVGKDRQSYKINVVR
ncbi:MAG: CotH kinase family protein, partial [Bacteroidota bacterium]